MSQFRLSVARSRSLWHTWPLQRTWSPWWMRCHWTKTSVPYMKNMIAGFSGWYREGEKDQEGEKGHLKLFLGCKKNSSRLKLDLITYFLPGPKEGPDRGGDHFLILALFNVCVCLCAARVPAHLVCVCVSVCCKSTSTLGVQATPTGAEAEETEGRQ